MAVGSIQTSQCIKANGLCFSTDRVGYHTLKGYRRATRHWIANVAAGEGKRLVTRETWEAELDQARRADDAASA